MSEMQDRIAAALEAKRAELINQPLARVWPELAKTAIEGMREPTVEMLVAAQEEWMCVRAAEERADFIWRAMIDTALV